MAKTKTSSAGREIKHVAAEGHKAAKAVHKVDSSVYMAEVMASGNPRHLPLLVPQDRLQMVCQTHGEDHQQAIREPHPLPLSHEERGDQTMTTASGDRWG